MDLSCVRNTLHIYYPIKHKILIIIINFIIVTVNEIFKTDVSNIHYPDDFKLAYV